MYLKSLEISGFKSFAKKAVLDFKTPITAIVGPNGSGKSNVAEAFRFVLGEQSLKSMRGKKGEDLIFNGGKNLSKMNRASVRLVFDNSRRVFNIDFDEIAIERAVHRDGVNEYFLNGSQVRLKDVVELLAQAHIGASGHHIISQGEADRILSANIRERREMIEDALGLKIYHYKKQESEKKLEKTEENLKQVQSLRREIAPHIRFLEKQVEKVEKARQMREELRELYKHYFALEQAYITKEKKRIADEKREPEERYAALEQELKAAQNTLAASHDRDEKSTELLAFDAKIKEMRVRKDALGRDIGRIEGSIASLERTIKRQEELLASDENKMVSLREVEILGKEITDTIGALEKEEDLGKIRQILVSIRERMTQFIGRNHTTSDTTFINDARAEIQKFSAERADLEAQMAHAVNGEEMLRQEYNRLKDAIEKEKDTNRDAEMAVFRIMAEQNEVVSKLNILTAAEEKVHHTEEDMKRELGEAAALIGRDVLAFTSVQVEEESREAQEERRRKIEKIKIRLEDAGIGGSEEILKEYNETKERDAFLAREIEDLEKTAESLRTLIQELEMKLDAEFKIGIDKINKQFKEFFALMFGGGEARLDVVRQEKRRRKSEFDTNEEMMEAAMEDEETEEGIDIYVSHPHKKIKGLVMLSGGERALTSIALLFAMSQVNPPPFIILDETDAALDEANSRKYGDMIENLARYSQLILITHNRETMSRAGVLYGVTMSAEGFSKLLSIEFDEAVAVAK